MKTKRRPPTLILLVLFPLVCSSIVAQESPPQDPLDRVGGEELKKALNDEASGFWIYDDLEKAYAEGKRTGKPLLVSFRCVP